MKIRGFVKTIDANEQQFKAVDRDARIIEGYFSTKTLDRGGDVTLPSAFEKSLPTFMTNPVVCFQHDWNKPCGKVLDFKADDNGAWVQIQIAKGIKWVDEELWPAIDQGIIKAFSYGYKVVSNTAEKMGDRMVNLLKEVDLMEISVVTIPMNQTCLFSVADTGRVKGMEFVESKGLLRDKLDEEARERAIKDQISPLWDTFYAFRDCLEDCDPADINSLISEFSDILREQLSGLAVAGTLPDMMKQMLASETKAGRMISKPNETKIKGCTDKIRQAHKMATEACDELDGMIPEEPEEMKALTEEIIPYPIESSVKFNPNHSPENGQFTTTSGQSISKISPEARGRFKELVDFITQKGLPPEGKSLVRRNPDNTEVWSVGRSKGDSDYYLYHEKYAKERMDDDDSSFTGRLLPFKPGWSRQVTEVRGTSIEDFKSKLGLKEAKSKETETKSDMDDPEFQAQVTVLTDMIHQLSELVKA